MLLLIVSKTSNNHIFENSNSGLKLNYGVILNFCAHIGWSGVGVQFFVCNLVVYQKANLMYESNLPMSMWSGSDVAPCMNGQDPMLFRVWIMIMLSQIWGFPSKLIKYQVHTG